MEWNTAHGQIGSDEQMAKQDHTIRESIDKSSGGEYPVGETAERSNERKQYLRG
jgi:hypothetical protein